MRLNTDSLDLLTLEGSSPQWACTWDTAVNTLRMAPGGRRLVWPGVKDMRMVARAAQVRHPTGNNRDYGRCVLLSTACTILRVPRPGNLLFAVDKQWVAPMVLNNAMGLIMRLP